MLCVSGLNPQWGERFNFHLMVPDLAILRVNVKDYQTITSNDIIGQCSIPLNSLKTGTNIQASNFGVESLSRLC